jgi:hypothetical protein
MLPSAEGQTSIAIPTPDRYGKKGGTGARWCCWAGGRIAHATQLLDVVGLSFADGRGQDLLSSQLFPFLHSAAPTSSALPQHPFVEGCTITRGVHNVVSRGIGTMSAYWLGATDIVTGDWALDSEWLGGHGLEAEFCHPSSHCPVETQPGGMDDPVGQQKASRLAWAAGQRSTNSNDAANRIRFHHHALLAWEGI